MWQPGVLTARLRHAQQFEAPSTVSCSIPPSEILLRRSPLLAWLRRRERRCQLQRAGAPHCSRRGSRLAVAARVASSYPTASHCCGVSRGQKLILKRLCAAGYRAYQRAWRMTGRSGALWKTCESLVHYCADSMEASIASCGNADC